MDKYTLHFLVAKKSSAVLLSNTATSHQGATRHTDTLTLHRDSLFYVQLCVVPRLRSDQVSSLPLCSPPTGSGEQSIFMPVRGGASPGSASFRLRDGVLFHMYVSSSPCGDARLNCPYENTAASETLMMMMIMMMKKMLMMATETSLAVNPHVHSVVF